MDVYLRHQELNSNDSSNKVDFALVNRKMPNQTDHKELNSDVFDEFIVSTDIVHLFTIMKEFASKKVDINYTRENDSLILSPPSFM